MDSSANNAIKKLLRGVQDVNKLGIVQRNVNFSIGQNINLYAFKKVKKIRIKMIGNNRLLPQNLVIIPPLQINPE